MSTVPEDSGDSFEGLTEAEKAIHKAVVEAIRARWPEGDVEALAEGHAMRVPIRAPFPVSDSRPQAIIDRLSAEPLFRRAVGVLVIAFKDRFNDLTHDPDGETAVPYTPESWLRAEELQRQAEYLAQRIPFPYCPPRDVATIMAMVAVQTMLVPKDRKAKAAFVQWNSLFAYVNPLNDRVVWAPVHPRSVLIDLTGASSQDLDEIKGVLGRIQERLRYKKPTGAPKQVPEEQMRFVHELKTTPTGRAARRTWASITRAFNQRFGGDVSETTLKERYRAWTKRQNGTTG